MKSVLLFFIILFFFFPVIIVYAGCGDEGGTGGAVELCPPIDINNPQQLIGQVIKGILGIVGSLALAMFVYGGFVWMMAGGSSERVTKGKNILVWAAIGLVVIFSAYALVRFVFVGLGVAAK